MKPKGNPRNARRNRRTKPLPPSEERYREVVEAQTETQSVGRDITGRKLAQQALLETEERYRAIFERSRDAVYLLDFDGRFVDANPAALQMLGYARDEVSSTTLSDLLTSEEDLRRAHRAIQEVLTTGSEAGVSVYQLRRKDGALIWAEQQASLVCWKGKPFAIQGIARDITEQKRLTETLRLSEARYRSLVASSMDAVLLTVPEGRILAANEAACAMFGRTEPELIEQGRGGVVDTSDPRLAPALEERARTGRFKGELTLVRKDGTKFPAEVSSVVFTDEAGQARSSMVIRDVTERKQAEEELRKLTRAVEQSSAIVIITDLQGRIEYVNPKTCERTGYTAGELIGQNTRLFKSGHTSSEEYRRLWQTISCGGNWDGEFLNRKKNGSLFWERAIISPIKDETGRITHFVAIKEDITERKWAETALHDLSARLLQLQDEERRRLGLELHDTTAQSLAAVVMHLNVAKAGRAKLNERERKSLAEALALAGQCMREIRTLSHLLYPPMLDDLGLAGAVRDYADGFAERSGIRVDLELEPDLGRLPRATELALFRVLQEALTNVHRHSGSRTASIRLLRKPGQIRLEVSDTGRGMRKPGISVEQALEAPQLGVGIAGMRERLRQLGGRLEIDSDGSGTTIRAILAPAAECES